MSKDKGKTQNKKRKLTRQEKKQIDALIRQSKGDGKPHTCLLYTSPSRVKRESAAGSVSLWHYPNRPESSGTRVRPIRATPPPAINCFMPCDFANVR